MNREERLNFFRIFLSASRHNRLILHHNLVRSTFDLPLRPNIGTLSQIYIDSYYEFVDIMKRYGFKDELLNAITEEDIALEKIISTYEHRLRTNRTSGFV
jgi:hypothetical protein